MTTHDAPRKYLICKISNSLYDDEALRSVENPVGVISFTVLMSFFVGVRTNKKREQCSLFYLKLGEKSQILSPC